MAVPRNLRVVQSGVNTTNGNGQVVGAGKKVPLTKMPVRPTDKPWTTPWHPKHPMNFTD